MYVARILNENETITSESGTVYVVEVFLDSGGQGEIYRVRCDGQQYALKVYKPEVASKAQRQIFENLYKTDEPSPKFLWILDIVDLPRKKTFGYIMRLINTHEYKSISLLLKNQITPVPSLYVHLTTAILLADNFSRLHAKALAFFDISYDNIRMRPSDGDILIFDCDNINLKNKRSLVGGHPEFKAPELVINPNALPNDKTDRFSLANLLFHLLMHGHPLEGMQESNIECMDSEAMKGLYGQNPVFVYDPLNSSNRPDPDRHKSVIYMWDKYPESIRKLFEKAFTEGLKNPDKRIRDREWCSELLNARDSIVLCQRDKAENFVKPDIHCGNSAQPLYCWNCKAKIRIPPRIVISGKGISHSVILNSGTCIYKSHIENSFDGMTPIGQVARDRVNPSQWHLKNVSDLKWQFSYKGGTDKNVEKNDGVPLADGILIKFPNGITGTFLF